MLSHVELRKKFAEFWKNNGGLSVNTKLNNKVKEILENHVSKILDLLIKKSKK